MPGWKNCKELIFLEANISANEINNPQGQQENTLKENTITAPRN